MATYVEGFSHYGALQPEVKLLSCLVDEQGWDCVHLKQMRPTSRRVHITTWCRKSLLVLCVNKDVKPKQVVVVVETSNIFLDHVVNLFVATEDGFDHNIFHSVPERFWVLSSLSQPSPELVDWPLVILEEEKIDEVSCDRYLAARGVVTEKLGILVDGKICQVNQCVAQVFRLQTELLSRKSEEKPCHIKYIW